jgi:hypothetical protein
MGSRAGSADSKPEPETNHSFPRCKIASAGLVRGGTAFVAADGRFLRKTNALQSIALVEKDSVFPDRNRGLVAFFPGSSTLMAAAIILTPSFQRSS